jgi:hypothetical protein
MNYKYKSRSQILLISLLLALTVTGIAGTQGLTSTNIIISSSGTISSASPPSEMGPWVGFSSYPRTASGSYSTAIIDDIIEVMNAEGLTIYRMSIGYSVDPEPWVQYYLDHCTYDLIVCRHTYPPGSLSSSQWADVQTWTLGLLSRFSNYQDRLWVEPVNECQNSDLANHVQTIVTAVRNAGYTAKIVVNKWEQSWSSMASINDPLDNFLTGYHYYFNNGGWSSAESQMQQALDLGLHLFNTEIGANWNEEDYFSQSEVDRVTEFMAWCAGHGIGNTVWQRYGLENWDTYQDLGLQFPAS